MLVAKESPYPWLPQYDLRKSFLESVWFDSESDDDEEEEEDTESEDTDEESEDTDESGSGDKGEEAARIKQLNDENKRRRQENRDLKKQLKELTDKVSKGDKDEESKPKLLAVERERDQAKQERDDARLELAFTRIAFKLDFIDPEDVYSLIRNKLPDDVEEAEEDMEDILTELAKKKPYLLKKGGNGNADDGEGGSDEAPSGPSTKRRTKGKNQGLDRSALAKKYPALRGR